MTRLNKENCAQESSVEHLPAFPSPSPLPSGTIDHSYNATIEWFWSEYIEDRMIDKTHWGIKEHIDRMVCVNTSRESRGQQHNTTSTPLPSLWVISVPIDHYFCSVYRDFSSCVLALTALTSGQNSAVDGVTIQTAADWSRDEKSLAFLLVSLAYNVRLGYLSKQHWLRKRNKSTLSNALRWNYSPVFFFQKQYKICSDGKRLENQYRRERERERDDLIE